ncbi:MAG: insulinase family protein [Clostridiales bacterium]|nr:insulinase family protein [Clostridiales bacterium]
MADIKEISKAVRLVSVPTDRFKTSKISICFALPLKEETVASNALLPYLLHHSCAKYPSMELINNHLAMLYGASIGASVLKAGESQIMRLSISAIDDRFSLDNESISAKCAQLLCDLIFEPNFENGTFSNADIEQEKRLMIERIDSEMDDKRAYALRKCEELMCADEPYGLSKYGTKEQVKKLTADDVFKAWQRMLKTAKIQINVIGNADLKKIEESFADNLKKIGREEPAVLSTKFIGKADKIKEKTEQMEIKQGKLVMGLRVDIKDAMEKYAELSVMNDVFGGGPYSRLFANVREKMSLCYYCSSRLVRQKGVIFIQSGIETENKEKAVKAILEQFEIMKKGEFSKEDFEASKKAIVDALNSYGDMPEDIDVWYTGQIIYDEIFSTKKAVEMINKVTVDEVTKAAQLVTLDTIFMLEGTGDSEEGE